MEGSYYNWHKENNNYNDSLQRVAFYFEDDYGHVLDSVRFRLNPSQMTYSYGARNVFTQTLGKYPGMQGYGQGLHTIEIEGQTGYNQKGIIKHGPDYADSNFGRAKQLKHILYDELNQAHDDFNNMTGDRAHLTKLFFYNYTDEGYYQVELSPQGIQFSRSDQDPLSYYYTIQMTVIKAATSSSNHEKTPVQIGNHSSYLALRPYHRKRPYNHDTQIANNSVYNTRYSHPYRKDRLNNPLTALVHGRRSIVDDDNPNYDINSLEKQSPTSNVQPLSPAQKSAIMTVATNRPHTVHLNLGNDNPLNIKVGPNTPLETRAFWQKQMLDTNGGVSSDNFPLDSPALSGNNVSSSSTPASHTGSVPTVLTPPRQTNRNINFGVSPDFVHEINGNGMSVYVPNPKSDFMINYSQPDKTGKPMYGKRTYYRNNYRNGDIGIPSNILNNAITKNYVHTVSPTGDMVIESIEPNNDYTTLGDQNGVFHVQPNQYSPKGNQNVPIPAPITNTSPDYITVHKNGDNLGVQVSGSPQVHMMPNHFVISDEHGQMKVFSSVTTTQLEHSSDNWATVSINDNGHLQISPSGPAHVDKIVNSQDKSYLQDYLNGVSGSHTQFADNDNLILPDIQNGNNIDYTTRMSRGIPNNDLSDNGESIQLTKEYLTSTNHAYAPVVINGETLPYQRPDLSNQDTVPVFADKANQGVVSAREYDPNDLMGNTADEGIPTDSDSDFDSDSDLESEVDSNVTNEVDHDVASASGLNDSDLEYLDGANGSEPPHGDTYYPSDTQLDINDTTTPSDVETGNSDSDSDD